MSLATEPVFAPPTGFQASYGRIASLVQRYVYLVRNSWVRVVELVYWPFLQMVMWGFLQQYLAETASPYAQAAGFLIGSVLLWEILFRAKIGFCNCAEGVADDADGRAVVPNDRRGHGRAANALR